MKCMYPDLTFFSPKMTNRPGKEIILLCNTNIAFLICAEQHLLIVKHLF